MEGIWCEKYFEDSLIERSTMKYRDEDGQCRRPSEPGTYWTGPRCFNGAFKYTHGTQEFLQKVSDGGEFRCMYLGGGAFLVRNVHLGKWMLTHELPRGQIYEADDLPEHRQLSLNEEINKRDQTGTLVFGTDHFSRDAKWLVRVSDNGRKIKSFDLPRWIQDMGHKICNISSDMKLVVTRDGAVYFNNIAVDHEFHGYPLKLCMVPGYYIIFLMSTHCSRIDAISVSSDDGNVADMKKIAYTTKADVLSHVNQVSATEMLVLESTDDVFVKYVKVAIHLGGRIVTELDRVLCAKDHNWQYRYAFGVFR